MTLALAIISTKPPTENENQNNEIQMLAFYSTSKNIGANVTLSVIMSQNSQFVKKYHIDKIQKLDQWN